MHVELILEPAAVDEDPEGSGQYVAEPFRRTSWAIWSKGQMLAISGHAYRHRKSALRSLEAVTGGQVQMAREREDARAEPIALFRPDGTVLPIERLQ